MLTLELKSRSFILRMERGPRDWTKVYLFFEGRNFELGADSFKVVKERLLAMLQGESAKKPAGAIEGVDVYWATSFWEKHFTIYFARLAQELKLFIQNASAQYVATVILYEADRQEWIRVLQAEPEQLA